MTTARHSQAATLVRVGLAGALLLLVVQSVADLVASVHFHSYNSLVDLDRNNGIPDVLSSAMIVTAALGAFALAARSTRDRWQASALALLLAIVALDDVLQMEAGDANAWSMSVIVTLVMTTLLILAIARRASQIAGVTLLLGLSLLVVAVKNAWIVPYDQLLNMLGHNDQERGHLGYELGIVWKQGLEFLGWSLVTIGLWAAALGVCAQSRGRSAADAMFGPVRSLER
jgi:hypothetical protein